MLVAKVAPMVGNAWIAASDRVQCIKFRVDVHDDAAATAVELNARRARSRSSIPTL
jgi:hypothetical protein